MKSLKKLLCVLLSVAMVLGSLTVTALASESFYKDETTNVYHITSLEGLKEFRDQANTGALNGANDDSKHTKVVLDADIDLNNEEWTPINMSCVDFDGQNHTISNLKVTTEAKNVGLFGAASISTVKNITIDTATVTGINHVAAIAGDGLCSHFINCTVKDATITTSVKDDDDGDKAGAICGYLSAEPNAEVTNCTVDNVKVYGYRDIGALVGYANNAASVTGNTITNSTVYCDLKTYTGNYKNYTTDAAHDANQVIGEASSSATVSGNTVTNVNVIFLRPAAEVEVETVTDTEKTAIEEAAQAAAGSELTSDEKTAVVDAVSNAITEVTGNTEVAKADTKIADAVDATDSEIIAAANEAEGSSTFTDENSTIDKQITIKLESAKVDVSTVTQEATSSTVKVDTVTYDVKPVATVTTTTTDASGATQTVTQTVELTNEDLNGQAVTVRLAVPSTSAKQALVTHKSVGYDDEVFYTTVEGSGSNQYVEIQMTHFSEVTVQLLTGVTDGTAVAAIGNVGYATLADAFDAANAATDAATITLLADITLTSANGVTVNGGKDITVDLAGHDITANFQNTGACAIFHIANNGKLTMTDSVDTDKDYTDCGKVVLNSAIVGSWPTPNVATNVFTNEGTLVINGGYYENVGQGYCAYVVDSNSNTGNVSLTVNGGKLVAQYCPIRTFLNNSTTTNTVDLKDGIFEGRYIAYIQQPSATTSSPVDFDVEGGTYNCYETYKAPVDAFYIDALNTAKIDFSITGGNFSNTDTTASFVTMDVTGSITPDATIEISGGIYSSNAINAKYIKSGYTVIDNTDEATKDDYPYTIGVEKTYVAQIGDVKYETFAAAVAAANAAASSGAVTIELLGDVTLDSAISVTGVKNKYITITGDYTISCSTTAQLTAKYTKFECNLYVDGNVASSGSALNVSNTYVNRDIHVTGNAVYSYSYYGNGSNTSNVIIDGTISAGYFQSKTIVKRENSAATTITGGSFYGKVENAVISKGYFYGEVNNAEISGGTYTTSGTTLSASVNATTVSGGTFKTGTTLTADTITGGTFSGTTAATNITGGTFTIIPTCSNITGGTFQNVTDDLKATLEAELAEGYALEVTSTANQYVVVNESAEKVAAIGEVEYYTLEAALANATNNETVRMLKSIPTTATTAGTGTEATLELNGYTVGSITNSGTLTVQDSVGTGKIVNATNTSSVITNKKDATLTVKSGSICYEGNSTSTGVNAVQNSGTMTMTGGTISSTTLVYTLVNSGSTAKATISGGTITASGTGDNTKAIYVNQGGTVTINGGSITSTKYGAYVINGSTLIVEDGTLSGTTCGILLEGNYANVAKITGGNITGGISAAASIETDTETDYYSYLASAVTSATAGQTVKVLKDITLTSIQWIGKDLTLDLNGKTVSSGLAAVIATDGSEANVTVKDGTLKNTYAAGDNFASVVFVKGANSTLTLDGVTTLFTGSGTDENDIEVHGNAAGSTININECIISGNPSVSTAETTGISTYANNIALNVENTTINSSYFGVYHNGSYSGFNGTIENCTIIDNATGGAGVYISGSSSLGSLQNLTITDSKITGSTAVETKFTNVTINETNEGDTVLTATAHPDTYQPNGNGGTTAGVALAVTDNTDGVTSGTITVNGGHFNADCNIYLATKDGVTDQATITLNAGDYTNSIDTINGTGFVGEGKSAIANEKSDKDTYPTTIIVKPVAPSVDENAEAKTAEDTDVPEATEDKDAVKEAVADLVINDITENTAVASEDATDIQTVITDAVVTGAIDNTAQLKIVIKSAVNTTTATTVTDVSSATITTTTASYDVKPWVTIEKTVGEETTTETRVITNEELAAGNVTITFRLAVPTTMTGDTVKVKHFEDGATEADWTRTYVVEGEGDNRYVELSAKSFSTYELSQITEEDAVASITTADGDIYYYVDLASAVSDVQAGDTIKLLADSNYSFTLPVDVTFDTNDFSYTGTVSAPQYYSVVHEGNIYTVEQSSFVIKTTSEVGACEGGGRYDKDATATITATSVSGWTFDGWYLDGEKVSSDQEYSFTVTEDATYEAKYTLSGDGTFRLDVTASYFTVQDAEQEDHYNKKITAGDVTVSFTDDSKTFLYWVNGSGAIVSTSAEYTFPLVADTELKAVASSTSTATSAVVIFRNSFITGAQELQVNRYAASEDKAFEVSYPSIPSSYGRTFDHWAIGVLGADGSYTAGDAATSENIKAAILGGAKTVMIAPVYKLDGTYTITLKSVDDSGASVSDDKTYSSINSGYSYTVEAEAIEGKTFSHWEDADGNIIGTNSTYCVCDTTDVTIYAVYGEAIDPVNTVIMTGTASKEGSKYKLSFNAVFSIDSTKTIAKRGFLYSTTSTDLTYENLSNILYYEWDNTTANDSAMVYNLTASSATTTVNIRPYVILSDGTIIYGNMMSASYNSLAN